jgi:hypothetical protein
MAVQQVPYCPNSKCKMHQLTTPIKFYNKRGYFSPKWSHRPVPRYRCKTCKMNFSLSTFKDIYRQKKPFLNEPMFHEYSSGVSLRRFAKNHKCHKRTAQRKFNFVAQKSRLAHKEELNNPQILKSKKVIFDEMEWFIVNSNRQVSIGLAVYQHYDRKLKKKVLQIIDARVGRMPTHGYGAAARAVGWSKDQRSLVMKIVLNHVQKVCGNSPLIVTDSHPRYPRRIKISLPWATHMTDVQVTAATGDPKPLFWVNHACAMLRHNVSRLKRQALTYSQRISYLQKHLYLHIAWTNGYKIF